MPRILIRCRTFGKPVPTGLMTEKIRFDSLGGMQFSIICPTCGKIHRWKKRDAWIEIAAEGVEPADVAAAE
jgi:RNase P subunit RPR2